MDRPEPASLTVELLADRPDLIEPLARIRWRQWRVEDGREDLRWWVETTRGEAGRDGLPVTFVATDAAGEAVGGIGVIAQEQPELSDRGPWVVGVIVRADRRGHGIGTAIMARVRQWAAEAGTDRLWVATGGRAVGFYRHCGFEFAETATLANGERWTILTLTLRDARTAPP